MLVYRISASKYIEDLSGTGSKLYGGRWNDKGIAMVYFAETRAMAVMELLVHLRPEDLERNFILAQFEIFTENILKIDVKELPNNWKEDTGMEKLKKFGNKFIKDEKFLVMKVPSIIVEEEYNLVLNPNLISVNSIKLISKRIFNFDSRFKNNLLYQ